MDKNGIRHFSDSPPATMEQDATVSTQIKPSATQQQNQPQKDDGQLSDTPSVTDKEITDPHKRARLKAEIEKTEKLVAELPQSTEEIAATLNRARRKKRVLPLYRKYEYEQEKLQNAQKQLESLKSELQQLSSS